MRTAQAAEPRRRVLLALCFSAGLAGLSVAVTGPLLVDIAATYRISVALAGQLLTVASLAGMAGNLGLAPLLDRIGRREAICIALGGMALASLGSAAAPSFPILCATHGAVGLGGFALLAVMLAAVGDYHNEHRLGPAMGWIVAGNMGLGIVALPAVAALAEQAGWRSSMAFYAALAGLAAATAFWGLPRGVAPQPVEAPGYLQAFRSVLKRPAVLALLATVALYHASVYGLGAYMGAVAIQRLAATTAQTGPIFSLRALGVALAGLLVGRTLRVTDWRLTAATALACAVLSVAVYTALGSLWWFAVLALLQGAAVGVMDVTLNSLVVSRESAGRGALTALRSVMDGLGGVVGPALGGMAIAASGYPAAGWLFAALAVGAAASAAAAGGARQIQSRS